MLKKNILFIMLLLSGSLSSCDKFLEEAPSKGTSVPITTIAQVEALLDNYSAFYKESDKGSSMASDDTYMTTQIYQGAKSIFTPFAALQFMFWNSKDLPNNTNDDFWSTEFQKIFVANQVLVSLEKLAGSAQQKEAMKAEAHFIRAYSYFQLAQVYCLPYTEANKNELGLPLRSSTSFEEAISRQSLAATYQFIEADLQAALKQVSSLKASKKNWRSSIAGVHGFAARFYQGIGDHTKALSHAEAALSDHSSLVDYNTEMNYGNDVSIRVDVGTPQERVVEIKNPHTRTYLQPGIQLTWKESMYHRVLGNSKVQWWLPSPQLLALYDQDHDLRYEYHIVEHYSFERTMGPKSSFDYSAYIFFANDQIISGPTTAEMLLIKAESLARAGNVQAALQAVNSLRAKRMKPGAWVNLTAANKESALKQILEERRREMPFTRRWFDIRRLNTNTDPTDDVGAISRVFYEYTATSVLDKQPTKVYTLEKGSRRYAQPIPNVEIVASKGEIIQNSYDK